MYKPFLLSVLIAFCTLFSSPFFGQMHTEAANSIVFPLSNAKSVIPAGSSYNGEKGIWCSTSQTNCHHHYNAADIFAVTGTTVVAAVKGKVTQAHKTDSVGYTIHILGDDGRIYYHAHLGSKKVSVGQGVEPGQEIGAVGTAADAVYTQPHLHFDILKNNTTYNGLRPTCKSAGCQKYPFINPQPELVAAFSGSAVATGNGTVSCVITKVGAPKGPPPALPVECMGTGTDIPGAGGIEYPPNLKCKTDGYCQMPKSTDGSYAFEAPTCDGQHWGSKDLIGTLYTVAKRWKQKYPKGRLNIGDLNASGHKSHFFGIAVDMDATTDGKDAVADMTRGGYNREATTELGKLFTDTDQIAEIWYNDQVVNKAVLKYAKDTGKSSFYKPTDACPECSSSLGGMRPLVAHDNHFHVDVKRKYLKNWGPGC